MTIIQWECNITIARWMLDESTHSKGELPDLGGECWI